MGNSNTKTNNENTTSCGDLARDYIDQSEPLFLEADSVYRYTGKKYEAFPPKGLAHSVRRWLMEHGKPHSNKWIGDVVETIKSILDGVSKGRKMPISTALNFPKNVIAYNNGILDVDTGTLLPHTRCWVSTVCLPYDYDQGATCPQWLNFLNEIFEMDAQRIELLQEWFGYCLLPDTSHQKLLVKLGPPRAGKGTIDRQLHRLLGEENTTSFTLFKLGERFGCEALIGKHVATIGEVNLQGNADKNRIVATLNSIVGEDPQLIEPKFQSPFTVKLPTRFNISCNELPTLFDTAGALVSRMMILPFTKSFVGKEDRGLDNRLAAEICGINNWALGGLSRLRANGRFTNCLKADPIMDDFRRNTSSLLGFLQDEC